MLHLIKYNVEVKIKNFNMLFWPLVFPLILGTLFYFAFGNIDEADFETIPAAVVVRDEASGQMGTEVFLKYLDSLGDSEEALLAAKRMDEGSAVRALEQKEAAGIYFVGDSLSLAVEGSGMAESILQSVLESYEAGKYTMETVAREHPRGMEAAAAQMEHYGDMVREVSLGGRTIDGNAQYFYALIAMACMYGCFIGFGAVLALQANLTPLAARRSVSPTHKLKLILSEMAASVLLHFANVVVLLLYLRYVLKLDFQGQMGRMLLVSLIGSMIGVTLGMFVGSIGSIGEGAKTGILLGISMVCSFLAGLMSNQMKDIVERHAPLVNRLNPAALITDAFYCINVYDDTSRYFRSLGTLAVMCAVLIGLSFLAVRRECYDSI